MQRVYTITLIGSHIWGPLCELSAHVKEESTSALCVLLGRPPCPPLYEGGGWGSHPHAYLEGFQKWSTKKSQGFPKKGPGLFYTKIRKKILLPKKKSRRKK